MATRIMLVCAAGMSTSLLVTKMEVAAKEAGEEVEIFYGAHADDAAGEAYADCSPEFADAMDKAINIGTYGKIHINRPLIHLNKAGVVAEGLKLNVPYELTWSCYHGREKACGVCGTCIDRIAAFKANGIEDLISYEN